TPSPGDNGKDNHLDILSNLKELGRMGNFSRPGHLGNVDEPLNAAFQLNKSSIIHQANDLALDPGADRIFIGDCVPGVRSELFHTERDSLFLGIELQNNHFDLLSHLDNFGRMTDPAPRHVTDVENPIDATEV